MKRSTPAKATISSKRRSMSRRRMPRIAPIEENVISAAEFGVKSCSYFQKGANAPCIAHGPMGWLGYAGQYLKQSAFAGAIVANDPHHLAGSHLEGEVTECPKGASLIFVGSSR